MIFLDEVPKDVGIETIASDDLFSPGRDTECHGGQSCHPKHGRFFIAGDPYKGAIRATHFVEKRIPRRVLERLVSLNAVLLAKFIPDAIVSIGEARHLRTLI